MLIYNEDIRPKTMVKMHIKISFFIYFSFVDNLMIDELDYTNHGKCEYHGL